MGPDTETSQNRVAVFGIKVFMSYPRCPSCILRGASGKIQSIRFIVSPGMAAVSHCNSSVRRDVSWQLPCSGDTIKGTLSCTTLIIYRVRVTEALLRSWRFLNLSYSLSYLELDILLPYSQDLAFGWRRASSVLAYSSTFIWSLSCASWAQSTLSHSSPYAVVNLGSSSGFVDG